MNCKIFISARLTPQWVDKLRAYGDVDYYDWAAAGRLLDRNELGERIADSDVAVVESDEIPTELLDNSPKLKAIIVCRGTVINLDVKAASERGILVAHTPGRNADAVADLTVCLMIMISRHVHLAAATMANGEWVKLGKRDTYLKYQGIELYGHVAGLVGVGAIGRRTAKRLRAFDMQILGYDPYISPAEAEGMGVTLVDLDTLVSRADFISMHTAVTSETREMLGPQQIAHLKPTSYFINTARAELVHEESLLTALKENRIAGAAVDVYREEPLPLTSLWYTLPNVLCTPHIGGASQDVILHQTQMAIQGVIDFLEGREPEFVVNPHRNGGVRSDA